MTSIVESVLNTVPGVRISGPSRHSNPRTWRQYLLPHRLTLRGPGTQSIWRWLFWAWEVNPEPEEQGL